MRQGKEDKEIHLLVIILQNGTTIVQRFGTGSLKIKVSKVLINVNRFSKKRKRQEYLQTAQKKRLQLCVSKVQSC